MPQQLYEAVRELAAESPYLVTPTRRGFEVRVDLADARWYGLLQRRGLRTTFTHEVAVSEADRTYTITDARRTVSGEAGPSLSERRLVIRGSSERRVGRLIHLEKRKDWGWDDKWNYGRVVDYTLNTEESRSLIRTAARKVGYEERLPRVVKGAMLAAGVGALVAALTLVAVGLGAITGRF